MTDLAKWNVVGPVHTIRRESAQWDEPRQVWGPAMQVTDVVFRPDGRVAESSFHNPDGSIITTAWLYDANGRLLETQFGAKGGPRTRTLFTYDPDGRPIRTVEIAGDGTVREAETCRYDSVGHKTRVQFLPPPQQGDMGYAVEGSEISYGATEATTSTTTYDEHDLPSEVQFHDASHALVHKVVFTRDRDGRLLSEEAHFSGEMPFGKDLEKQLESASEKDRAQLMAVLEVAFTDGRFFSTSHEYDQKGRKLVSVRRMGTMDEDRTTFVYDDHDNVVEESSEGRGHSLSVDDDGNVQEKEDAVRTQRLRFEYQYDAKSNWTEKVTLMWTDSVDDFGRSSIERRAFTYY
jgi:hypothetical protein